MNSKKHINRFFVVFAVAAVVVLAGCGGGQSSYAPLQSDPAVRDASKSSSNHSRDFAKGSDRSKVVKLIGDDGRVEEVLLEEVLSKASQRARDAVDRNRGKAVYSSHKNDDDHPGPIFDKTPLALVALDQSAGIAWTGILIADPYPQSIIVGTLTESVDLGILRPPSNYQSLNTFVTPQQLVIAFENHSMSQELIIEPGTLTLKDSSGKNIVIQNINTIVVPISNNGLVNFWLFYLTADGHLLKFATIEQGLLVEAWMDYAETAANGPQ